MPTDRMVRLVTLHDPFEAKVLAARLGCEGVVWEVRGPLEGPYPGVGLLHLYVAEDDAEVAREVLSLAPLGDDDIDGASDAAASAGSMRWAAAVCVAVLAGVVVLRWLAMVWS